MIQMDKLSKMSTITQTKVTHQVKMSNLAVSEKTLWPNKCVKTEMFKEANLSKTSWLKALRIQFKDYQQDNFAESD